MPQSRRRLPDGDGDHPEGCTRAHKPIPCRRHNPYPSGGRDLPAAAIFMCLSAPQTHGDCSLKRLLSIAHVRTGLAPSLRERDEGKSLVFRYRQVFSTPRAVDAARRSN